jgi:hypothetical protein
MLILKLLETVVQSVIEFRIPVRGKHFLKGWATLSSWRLSHLMDMVRSVCCFKQIILMKANFKIYFEVSQHKNLSSAAYSSTIEDCLWETICDSSVWGVVPLSLHYSVWVIIWTLHLCLKIRCKLCHCRYRHVDIEKDTIAHETRLTAHNILRRRCT